jgi:glycosyltransferase involved in cell wall biosynthesis
MPVLLTATSQTSEPAVAHRRLARVLYAVLLDPGRKFGSLEEQVFILAREFRDRGGFFLPLFSAAPDPGTLRRYRDLDLEPAFLDLQRFRPGTLLRLAKLVRNHRIEVVHWNLLSPLGNPYLWALSVLKPGVRHYFTDHNSRTSSVTSPPPWPPPLRGEGWVGGWRRNLKRLLLKRYSRVVGVSHFVVDCLQAQRVWPAATCLHHFINTDRFAPDPEVRAKVRKRLGDEDRFVLATVAYLIEAKGIDVAIRALALLPEKVCLWVVGDGEESGRLQALARELGVADRVRMLGLQSFVQPFLQAADACVCPSRWAEAAGLVNLEAQAAGVPMLASDIGGIPEYVADGQSGFLFPVGDHVQLAERVRRLTDDDSELCRTMGQAARSLMERKFSVEARLPDYLALYESSIEAKVGT